MDTMERPIIEFRPRIRGTVLTLWDDLTAERYVMF